jgi:uncharacterized protein (TIGR02265 family)
MSETRVVFSQGLEALFSREIRALLTPELVAELKDAGVDLNKPFLPAYPIETWAAIVDLLARRLYPKDSIEAAYWKLGRSTTIGFGETFIGKAAFGFLKLVGPVRAVERAARSYANTNNYTKVELKRLGDTSFQFWMNEKHTLPEYDMGVVEAMLEYVGAKSPQITLIARDQESFTMKLDWQA